jgi:hypothetical protein
MMKAGMEKIANDDSHEYPQKRREKHPDHAEHIRPDLKFPFHRRNPPN